jgi:lipopolysaccharide heptosyltransferase II
MAAPTVHALGRLEPGVRWRLWGVPRTLPLFEGLDAPFELHPLPASFRGARKFAQVVAQVRRVRSDAALIFPPSLSSALVSLAAGTPRRFGSPGEGRAGLLTDLGPRPRRDLHLREQYGQLGALLARRLWQRELPDPPEGSRLWLRAEEIAEADAAWGAVPLDPAQTIALAPGATYGRTKMWPEDRFLALGKSLVQAGFSLLWFGGPAERRLCAELAAGSGGPEVSVSIAGSLSLRQSLARLARVRVLVSNDSGAMHMGQASGVPVVGIFGSTSPTWTGPVGPNARVVYLGVHCSPCFARTCPTQIECLGGITVDAVRTVVLELASAERAGLRPAVFLDRDGTLIELVPYLRRPEDVRLVEGAVDALRDLAAAGFALVLVTNQSVVARGEASLEDVARVHARIEELLEAGGVRLDRIESCPHHPDFGGTCSCRKPEPGMLLRAAHGLGLDLTRSWMLGDNESDLEAAARAGVRFGLLRTGYGREVEARASGPLSAFDELITASQAILSSLP